MIKKMILSFLMALMLSFPNNAKAWWGPDGHTIFAKLAMQFINPDTRQNVLQVLNGMSLDTASNWMDIRRSNPDYDFMKPWHYINIASGMDYQPSSEENIVNRLIIVFNELRQKKVLCAEEVKMDLLLLFHLMGDLHQPLHAGYDDDLGGNKIAVEYEGLKTNLHHFWDEYLIRLNRISMQSCLDWFERHPKPDSIDGIHPVLWMKESRSLLRGVYDYSGFILTENYVKRKKAIIERQLVLAGLRLAEILNKIFMNEAAAINIKVTASKYKDGIDAADAGKYIGKKVTACGRVYGVKTTDKVTFINVGAAFPNSPLTIVIFAKDRKNFSGSLEELFANKNICVKGQVVEYNGKAEIIVSKPEGIIIQ